MNIRLSKLEEAREVILEKVWKTISKDAKNNFQNSKVETYLQMNSRKLLFIGKNDRYIVENLNSFKIENMLNLLRQFGLINSYERVVGDVFKIILIINPKADAKVIQLKSLKVKVAAAA
jgi:hypothetical protein